MKTFITFLMNFTIYRLFLLILPLLLCHFSNRLICQSDANNYFKIKDNLLKDFKSTSVKKDQLDQSQFTDSENTDYFRWIKFWSTRTNEKGDLSIYFNEKLKSSTAAIIPNDARIAAPTSSNCNECTTSTYPSNWRFLGPIDLITQNLGRIDAIWINPVDQNNILAGAEGGIWKTVNGGVNWSNLNDFCIPGIGIKSIAVQKNNTNIIYIGTGYDNGSGKWGHSYGYGIYKTTDGGANWTKLNVGSTTISDENYCSEILIHPNFNNIIYATLGSKVYKSINSGNTWHVIFNSGVGTLNPESLKLIDIELNPNITTKDELYISSLNKLIDWNGLGTYSYPYYNWSNRKYATARIWRCESNFTSTTLGTSLIDFSSTLTNYPQDCEIAKMCFTLNSYNIMVKPQTNNIKFFRKFSGSLIWQLNTPTGLDYKWPLSFFVPAISPNDPNVFVGGLRMYKSVNGGVNFNTVPGNYHDDIRIVKFQTPTTFAFGTDGGISKSIDAGSTAPSNINGNSIQLNTFYGISNNERFPNLIYGGTQDNGLYNNSTYDVNGNWYVKVWGDSWDAASDLNNALIAYCSFGVMNANLYKTQDGGRNWTSIGCPVANDCSYSPLVVDNQNRLYTGIKNLYRYTGANWTQITIPNTLDKKIASFKLTDDGNQAFIIYGEPLSYSGSGLALANKVFKISNLNSIPFPTDITKGTNNSTSSDDLEIVRWCPLTDIAIEPVNGSKVFVCFGSVFSNPVDFPKRVYKYENGIWSPFGQGLPNLPCNSIEYFKGPNDLLFVGTDDGVYYRKSGMTSWSKFQCNLPHVIISDLEINYNLQKLRAATYGRGIWETSIPN